MKVGSHDLTVSRTFPRIGRLSAEYYEYVDTPEALLEELRSNFVGIDIFTFLQRPIEPGLRWSFPFEKENISVLKLTSYEEWWKKQVNDKTRNMVRRAYKKGVEIRQAEFTDEFVHGIQGIYDESRLRQGKPFLHYGKDLETLRRSHATFMERSDFIGAYWGAELIGFLKLVHGDGISNIMQIFSKNAHRDKAPTNALLAKAVEICTERRVPFLHYGLWSRRGLGDFKKHHGFERVEVPRYYIALGVAGRIAMLTGLHMKIAERLPEDFVDRLISLRTKWNVFVYEDSSLARHWKMLARRQ